MGFWKESLPPPICGLIEGLPDLKFDQRCFRARRVEDFDLYWEHARLECLYLVHLSVLIMCVRAVSGCWGSNGTQNSLKAQRWFAPQPMLRQGYQMPLKALGPELRAICASSTS